MDQFIAFLLLKIFKRVWDNHFAPQATPAINAAVTARYDVLKAAVLAGNVPNVDWAKVRYLTVNGYVVKVGLAPQQTWTLEEWGAKKAGAALKLAQAQEQLDGHPQDLTEAQCVNEDGRNFINSIRQREREIKEEEVSRLQAELVELQAV